MAISDKKRAEIVASLNKLMRTTGRHPTVQEVIADMGRGSASYVTPVRREWIEELNKTQDVVRKLPDSVTQIMLKATADMWHVSVQEADSELRNFKEQASAEVRQLTAERDAALGDIESLEAKVELQQIEIAGSAEVIEGLRAQLGEVQRQLAKLQSEKALAEQKVASLASQLDDKKADLEEAKAAGAKLQQELLELAKGGSRSKP
ncbi:DNA-binding protein [Marinobacter sp.]|uniref:DNA-binding protein n=1 Tax=Marinobacter sp. TaxID=50741 RepID=UPI003A925851